MRKSRNKIKQDRHIKEMLSGRFYKPDSLVHCPGFKNAQKSSVYCMYHSDNSAL